MFLRFQHFNNLTARQKLQSSFEIGSLPPTQSAINYHLLRTYHQVQQWMGNDLDMFNFGWQKSEDDKDIYPVQTQNKVAPDFILNLVFCNCKQGCTKNCTCKKFNFKCTSLCGNCRGISCSNKEIDLMEE